MIHRMVGGVLTLILVSVCQGCQPENTDELPSVQYLNAPSASNTLPFSEAVRVGDVLYLSGRIGSIPGQGLAPGGVQAETRQALENIKAVLERHGSSLSRVVKCTVMLADMGEWGAMNDVYAEFFPINKPARSAFGTSGLAAGARVEIECMAAIG